MHHAERLDLLTRGALVALAVALLALAITFALQFRGSDLIATQRVNTDGYQAVVLEGRQVYFGRLRDLGAAYVRLEDAHYEPVGGVQQAGRQPDGGAEVTLLKVGQDLPQAEPTLYISADKLVSWENLRNDSKVVKAIKDNQNK